MKTYILFLIFCVGCIAPNQTKKQARILLLSLHLNPTLMNPKVPDVAVPNVSEPDSSQLSPANIINPDSKRIDTRYELSQAEIQYILEREEKLKEAGLLSEESLDTTKNDIKKAVYFLELDQTDREAYLDEIELGLPHKERVLTDEEWEEHLKKLEGMTEKFYAEVWNDVKNLEAKELQTTLLNVSANIYLIDHMERHTSLGEREQRIFGHNKEHVVYLRRRIIALLIEKGER